MGKNVTAQTIVARGFSDKVLCIGTNRGEHYQMDYLGRIKRMDQKDFRFSDTWILLGFSTHWNSGHPTISPQMAFDDPNLIKGRYIWDIDHGTTRQWGNGVKVAHAYLTDRILDCGHKPSPHGPHTNGIAHDRDGNREICWACAADRERVDMCRTGKWTGYLYGLEFVDGWTSYNLFPIWKHWRGDHNIVGRGKRVTVRFIGPDGHWWSGTHIDSGMTQLTHCRRMKVRATSLELEYNGKKIIKIKTERVQQKLALQGRAV
jgi:hypothetical protein